MAQGHFIITDISGYTEFLTRSELDHAHDILQTLFQAQLELIKPPFIISGFRGDAIFMYVPESNFVQPQSVLEAIENLYIAFSSTSEQMQFQTTCPCRACKGMGLLDLKVVAHYGSYLVQQLGDREELLGADVIVPHRMLKNSVVEETGINSYALFSEAATNALRLPEFCDELHTYSASYEHIGEMKMAVYDLKIAWEKEKARRSKVVAPDEAWVKVEVDVPVAPSLLWDYMITPELKIQMTGLDTMERVDGLGGRTGEGTEYHCAHGSGVIVNYKIVTWKPFDHFTMLLTDTMTDMEYYETYYFIPTERGTHFMSCVSKPEGDVPEKMQAMVQELWEEGYSGINPLIEKALGSAAVKRDTKT